MANYSSTHIPNSNVSISDVKDTMTISANNLSSVCTSSEINPISIWKPISSAVSTLTRDEIMKKYYSLELSSPSSISSFSTSASNPTKISVNYTRPAGGSSSPYRLGDFRNYEHLADSDISLSSIRTKLNNKSYGLYDDILIPPLLSDSGISDIGGVTAIRWLTAYISAHNLYSDYQLEYVYNVGRSILVNGKTNCNSFTLSELGITTTGDVTIYIGASIKMTCTDSAGVTRTYYIHPEFNNDIIKLPQTTVTINAKSASYHADQISLSFGSAAYKTCRTLKYGLEYSSAVNTTIYNANVTYTYTYIDGTTSTESETYSSITAYGSNNSLQYFKSQNYPNWGNYVVSVNVKITSESIPYTITADKALLAPMVQ